MIKRRYLVIGLAVIALVIIAGLIVLELVFPNNPQPIVTGVPTESVSSIDQRRTATAEAQTRTAAPSDASGALVGDGLYFVTFRRDSEHPAVFQEEPLYESCTALRVRAPQRPDPTPTSEATAELTPEATEAVVLPPPGEPDLVRLAIVGSESEACYVVPEVFLGVNDFRIAVGVTRSIAGEIEIDRANIANSLVGDIVVNISEFRSDEGRRDAAIQNQWIQTNRYPFVTYSEIVALDLPARPYEEGEVLQFRLSGILEIRTVQRETIFNATARLVGDVLVVRAETDIRMTDFGFDPPNMAGFVRTDDEMRIVLNLVARPSE